MRVFWCERFVLAALVSGVCAVLPARAQTLSNSKLSAHLINGCKDDINAPSWTPLGTDSVAAGYALSRTDTNALSQQRFYRVMQVN